MNQVGKLRNLESLSCFDINTLSQFVELSANSLYANIKRWLKKGLLVKLKNGLYVTGTFLDRHSDSEPYYEFIANKIYEPSYLSGEYVLQKYNMLTDAVYAWTSVTLKTKREFQNRLGRFIFRSVRADLFTGYEIHDRAGFQIKIAGKSKALFDYLYLKFYRKKVISAGDLELLRLNLDGFSAGDLEEFSTYCNMTGIAKFRDLPKALEGIR